MGASVTAAAVVVYNTACTDSSTCRALAQLKRPGLTVLIYDNSTRDYGNAEFCRQMGWVYLGGNGNNGISKAYNGCVDYLKQNRMQGLLCLFDDDTELSGDYFSALEAASAADDARVYVPLIRSGGRILSPCRLSEGHRVTLFGDEREALAYRGSDLSAINSGMAVDLRIFDDFRYDEHIFLDGVDHAFTRKMHASGNRIRVFDYCCDHAFSGDSLPSREAAMTRFRIYAKDYAYILADRKWDYLLLVGKRALHLCMQYKSPGFFLEWIKNY